MEHSSLWGSKAPSNNHFAVNLSRLTPKALKIIGLSQVRLYISGSNLITLTKYPGLDPEMTVSNNSLNEGDRAAGIDWGTYPSAMTILFGINVTF